MKPDPTTAHSAPPGLVPSAIERHSLRIVAGVAAVALGAYLSTFWSSTLSRDQSHWGTFGDFFNGALAPVIATLTLWWLIKAVRLQRRELAELRDSARATIDISESTARVSVYLQLRERYIRLRQSLDADCFDERKSLNDLAPAQRNAITEYWYQCHDEWFVTHNLTQPSSIQYERLWDGFFEHAIGTALQSRKTPLYEGLQRMRDGSVSFGPHREAFLAELDRLVDKYRTSDPTDGD